MQSKSSQTQSQLMRTGNRFFDRDFMPVLNVDYVRLYELEANPSTASLNQLKGLAALLGYPVMKLVLLAVPQTNTSL